MSWVWVVSSPSRVSSQPTRVYWFVATMPGGCRMSELPYQTPIRRLMVRSVTRVLRLQDAPLSTEVVRYTSVAKLPLSWRKSHHATSTRPLGAIASSGWYLPARSCGGSSLNRVGVLHVFPPSVDRTW